MHSPLLKNEERLDYGTTESLHSLVGSTSGDSKGYNLAFRNIFYEVTVKQSDNENAGSTTKRILDNVSGRVRSKETLAIMGPSGSGKTTLLDILSGKAMAGSVKGDVFLNGNYATPQALRCLCGFVPQHDNLLSTPTVREAILFSAMLRLPLSISVEEKERKVDEMLKILDLVNCKDTMIGGELFRGISGGEKKRTSVGVELITNPGLIFLDEPTTGLDSSTSFRLINILKKMSRNDCSVVCTIHQPDMRVFELFDKVLLLDSRGGVAFHGLTSELLPYLETFDKICPDYHNPADFALDVIHEDSNEGFQMRALFEKSEGKQLILGDIERDVQERSLLPGYSEASFATPFLYQLLILMKRSWKHSVRNQTLFPTMTITLLLFGLLIGAMYYQLPTNEGSLRDRISSIIFVASVTAFLTPFCIIAGYPQDKVPYTLEKSRRMYHPVALAFSLSMHSLPVVVPANIVATAISYYMIGLRSGAVYFFKFLLINSLLLEVGMAFATTVSLAFSSSAAVASLIFSLAILAWSFLLPFYIPESRIPDYMIWIERTSFLKYATNAMIETEFQGQTYSCDPIPCFPKSETIVVGNVTIPTSAIPYDCFQPCLDIKGDDLLDYYNIDLTFGECAGILVSMIILWRVLLFWILSKK